MAGLDLYEELSTKVVLLDKALGQLGKRGREYANCEQTYRVALAKKMLTERDKGLPATILSDVCRGDKEIARFKFERDVAEVTYKSALEAINCYKVAIRVLENQITREYGNA